jgi:hypothetical protein
MANVDPNNPYAQPRGMVDGMLSAGQGMFGGLKRGFQAGGQALHPYSNRLMLAGMGLLSGRDGMQNAMKGLVAGSALDTEDADRRKLNKALQALQDDPESLSNLSSGERNFVLNDAETARLALAQRVKPADIGEKYQGYLSAKAEGYTGDWMQYQADTKAAGVTVNTGQIPAEMGARIGLGDNFLDELNVASINGGPPLRERIKTVFGGDVASQTAARGQLASGMGEPAAIWRRVESGKEALIRQLTGAGKSEEEAKDQAARYSIGPTDSVTTMLDKMDGLERDLQSTRGGAIGARKGTLDDERAGSGKLTPNEDGSFTWSQ